jgi:hypothetical protein
VVGEAESLQWIGAWMSHAGSRSGEPCPIVSSRKCAPILPNIALLWKNSRKFGYKSVYEL